MASEIASEAAGAAFAAAVSPTPQPSSTSAANLTVAIVWQPDHYFADFWLQGSDPYLASLPLLPVGAPIAWGFFILFLGISIKFLLPWFMSSREAMDVRPITLILDGFAFGGYVTGLLSVTYPTRFFADCFDCSAYSPSTTRYDHLVVKHFAYAVIFAKMFDFVVPICFTLAKKERSISSRYIAYLMSVSLGTVCLVKLNPGGIFVFAALIDAIHSVIFYSYLTFASADPLFRPSFAWKTLVFSSKMLSWSLILAHSAYFLALGPTCGQDVVKLALAGFSILVLVLFPYDCYVMHVAAVERTDRKDVQRAIRRVSRLSIAAAAAGGRTRKSADAAAAVAAAAAKLVE